MFEKKKNSTSQDSRVESVIQIGLLAVLAFAAYMAFYIENGLAKMGISLLGIGILSLTINGIRTGKMELRGGHVLRHENPIAFWVFGLLYAMVGLFMLGFVATNFLQPL